MKVDFVFRSGKIQTIDFNGNEWDEFTTVFYELLNGDRTDNNFMNDDCSFYVDMYQIDMFKILK
jgi:hypothetical protein